MIREEADETRKRLTRAVQEGRKDTGSQKAGELDVSEMLSYKNQFICS